MNSINANLPSHAINHPEKSSDIASSKGEIEIDGTTIKWPDDGWYEVQSATSFNTIAEGGRSVSLPHGTYTVINHTTGERFENITIGQSQESVLVRSNKPKGIDPERLFTDVVEFERDPDIPIYNPITGEFDRPFATGVLADPSGITYDIGNGILTSGPSDPPPPIKNTQNHFVTENSDGSTTHSITHEDGSKTEITHNNDNTTTVTESKSDSDDPSAPVTNVTTTYDPNGDVIDTETTVTTPTGMTIGESGANDVPDNSGGSDSSGGSGNSGGSDSSGGSGNSGGSDSSGGSDNSGGSDSSGGGDNSGGSDSSGGGDNSGGSDSSGGGDNSGGSGYGGPGSSAAAGGSD